MDHIVVIVPSTFEEAARVQRQVDILSKDYAINIVDIVWDKSKNKNVKKETVFFHHVVMPKWSFSNPSSPAYAIKRLIWIAIFYFQVFVVLMKLFKKHGRICVHSNHLYTLPIGFAFKKITGCKLVYDAQEFIYFQYIKFKSKYVRLLIPVVCRIEKGLGRRADLTFTWWRTQAGFFRRTYGLQSVVFPNLFPPDFLARAASPLKVRKKLGIPQDDFVVLYAGGLSQDYKLNELLDASEILINKHKINRIRLVIAGMGPLLESLKNRAKRLGIAKHCIFPGFINYEKIMDLYNVSNVVYVQAEPEITLHRLLPSGKIFEAMICKKPVITCHLGEKMKLVSEAKCGLCVKPEVAEIARALLKFVDNEKMGQRMGINGYEYYVKNYSWKKYSRIFLSAYENYCFLIQ